MAGGTHTEQNQINWAERYIMELSILAKEKVFLFATNQTLYIQST